MNDFIESARKQFEYYKMLGDKAMQQLSDEQLFWSFNEESNSIATIVKHLWGNMLSRWTDFLNSDGEKEWRKRDEEFENNIKTKEELISKITEYKNITTIKETIVNKSPYLPLRHNKDATNA